MSNSLVTGLESTAQESQPAPLQAHCLLCSQGWGGGETPLCGVPGSWRIRSASFPHLKAELLSLETGFTSQMGDHTHINFIISQSNTQLCMVISFYILLVTYQIDFTTCNVS